MLVKLKFQSFIPNFQDYFTKLNLNVKVKKEIEVDNVKP